MFPQIYVFFLAYLSGLGKKLNSYSFYIIMKAFITNIQRFSIHDGPGIRTSVFFKGCPLSCWWCHNPECMGTACLNENSVEYTLPELVNQLLKDEVFYCESGGGVTFSGGEPLYQSHFLRNALNECVNLGIHTTVDTSGFAPEKSFQAIMPFTNPFLFDLKLINDTSHKKFTGVSNKSILHNLQLLDAQNHNVIIRIPLIPGITNTIQNITDTVMFLKTLNNKYPVSLLKYHNFAANKYLKLNLEYPMNNVSYSDGTDLETIKYIFLENGFNIS